MKYSVIIPAYNTAEDIIDAVKTVKDSGLLDFEIIIVDDGSSDCTARCTDQLLSVYSNAVCIHQVNSGVSSARNHGVKGAQGEYIWFVDADDIVEPNSLIGIAKIVDEKMPDIILFGMSFEYYFKNKRYETEYLSYPESGMLSVNNISPQVLKSLFDYNYLTPVWNKIIKKEIIQCNRICFNESMELMEDCLFSLICLSYSRNIYLISEPCYRYQVQWDSGRAGLRLKNITSLVDYMKYFSAVPKEWRFILNRIYYMLLGQKIRVTSLDKLSMIAEDHKRSVYKPEGNEKWLDDQLRKEKYLSIKLKNWKSSIRHYLAVGAKVTGIYHKRQC